MSDGQQGEAASRCELVSAVPWQQQARAPCSIPQDPGFDPETAQGRMAWPVEHGSRPAEGRPAAPRLLHGPVPGPEPGPWLKGWAWAWASRRGSHSRATQCLTLQTASCANPTIPESLASGFSRIETPRRKLGRGARHIRPIHSGSWIESNPAHATVPPCCAEPVSCGGCLGCGGSRDTSKPQFCARAYMSVRRASVASWACPSGVPIGAWAPARAFSSGVPSASVAVSPSSAAELAPSFPFPRVRQQAMENRVQ